MAKHSLKRLRDSDMASSSAFTVGRVYHVVEMNDYREFVVITDRGLRFKVGNGAIANGFWAWVEDKMVSVPKSMLLRAKEIVDGVV